MHEDIIKRLYDTFKLSTRQGTGGMTFKYVPNEDVINRMNDTFKGDWSTAVKFRDVIDDQVILEVEVTVLDPDTKITHSHTGFGSQQIMRYNSGPNAGKIIDIGNGYKGALAKAIVNACTRWGVGLFKESNPTAEATATPVEMPALPVLNPVPAAPAAPEPPTTVAPVMPMPDTTATAPMPVMPTTTAAPEVVAPPTTAGPAMPVAPVVPMMVVPEVVPVAETTTTFAPPLSPEQPVSASISIGQEVPALPTIPPPAAEAAPATPDLPFSKDDGLDGIKISDVQKVALNGILTMNNAEYAPLAVEAFTANGIDKTPPSREDLNYEEAVIVIKFGNEKYRKNR